MKQMEVVHPTARMLVEISKAQDIEAGDGTTTVVVIAGALLHACQLLLEKGIHPTQISDGFQVALERAHEIVSSMSIPISLDEREKLIQIATTSLSSKVVSQHSDILAPIAVDSVLKITEEKDTNIDLRNINVSTVVGGTVDETELIEGLVFPNKKASHSAGGPSKMDNAKIGLIQFCISAPKTDMENQITVKEYSQMDKILDEERKYIINIIKKIVKAGCNVLLIQKSIMRDAVNDLALHFLAKKKIMVIKNIDRDQVDFISKTVGCIPVASVEQFTAEKLGFAEKVYEHSDSNTIRFEGCRPREGASKTVSVLVRGSNQLIADEAERSLHDALCVVRCLVKERSIVPGGAAVEMEIAQKLQVAAREIYGTDSYCVRAFAEALEVVPYTLAENAGLDPVSFVTQ